MRARQVLLESLLAQGVQYIFGNPGSTENAVVDGVFDYPDLTYILALHEGVALGAANYYAQASGKTAVVNLHAAPGLGNAIGMMYGSLRANSPMVITAGQQDTRMLKREPILSHDLAAMAAPVVKWSKQIEHADEVGLMVRRAFQIANEGPKGPVFLSLPLNVMEDETNAGVQAPGAAHQLPAADNAGLDKAAEHLLAAKKPLIIAGDGVAQGGAGDAVARLGQLVGAEIWFEPSRARCPVATDLDWALGSLPFDSLATRAILDEADVVFLIGGRFFEELWFNEDAMPMTGGAKVLQLDDAPSRIGEFTPVDLELIGDLAASVAGLADRIEADTDEAHQGAAKKRIAGMALRKTERGEKQAARAGVPGEHGKVSVPMAMKAMRDALPGDPILVTELITTRPDFENSFTFKGANDYYAGRGGGIGQGIAGAIGVQLAHPGRPVIALSGDGSAMYSIQALWTAARHNLPIIFVIFVNREYKVLKRNLDEWRRRFGISSNQPNELMDLTDPALDFVALADGMGVAATRVTEDSGVGPAMEAALASGKPHLIELEI
ncbi:MAG: thiamine pyrophosphate-binding protein [Rhodospirillales bacterium]|nr:thiamine pyrophosphate-binding protein [Rhodospirillales bacterium]